MIDERFEISLTQYLDGTLPQAQRAAVEARLAADPEARALLQEHRRLDAVLRQPMPEIDWDRLAEHLCQTVAAQEDSPVRSYRIGLADWGLKLAMAASVMLAVGLGLAAYLRSGGRVEPAAATATGPAIVQVSGPQVETAAGPVADQVTIGPSEALARDQTAWKYIDGVVARPSRVAIASGSESRY